MAARESAVPSTSQEVGGAAPVLLCDTRQQRGKHKNIDEWLDAHGIPYEYRKLDFGDYARADGVSNIVVDTKQDVQEVAGNLGHDHGRFVRECERAAAAGYRLVILIEEGKFRERLALAAWTPTPCHMCRKCDPHKDAGCRRSGRRRPMQGTTVARIMQSMTEKYGVVWEFCYRKDTARRICELLGLEVDVGE